MLTVTVDFDCFLSSYIFVTIAKEKVHAYIYIHVKTYMVMFELLLRVATMLTRAEVKMLSDKHLTTGTGIPQSQTLLPRLGSLSSKFDLIFDFGSDPSASRIMHR